MDHIQWEPDGSAEVLSVASDKIELLSTRSFPPGSRPRGSVGGASFWIKVHGSHREADGRFRVTARLLDAPRALRADLERFATRRTNETRQAQETEEAREPRNQ